MELWIRSQDGLRLAKMDSIIINVRNKKEITSNYSYTSDGFEKDIPLGEYNSEERALEVLDEIQRILQPKIIINNTSDDNLLIINGEWVKSIKAEMKYDIKELSTVVYEMPKE